MVNEPLTESKIINDLHAHGLEPSHPLDLDGRENNLVAVGTNKRKASGKFERDHNGERFVFYDYVGGEGHVIAPELDPSKSIKRLSAADKAAQDAERKEATAVQNRLVIEKAEHLAQARYDRAIPIPCDASLNYFSEKKLPIPSGARYCPSEECVLIPFHSIDEPHKLQAVQRLWTKAATEGTNKKFVYGTVSKETYYSMAGTKEGPLLISEGVANALRATLCTGYDSWAAGGTSNLVAVAKFARKRFPDRTIILLADNDQKNALNHNKNTGFIAAEKAAKPTDGLVAYPPILALGKNVDVDDLFHTRGTEAVQLMVDQAKPVAQIEPRFPYPEYVSKQEASEALLATIRNFTQKPFHKDGTARRLQITGSPGLGKTVAAAREQARAVSSDFRAEIFVPTTENAIEIVEMVPDKAQAYRGRTNRSCNLDAPCTKLRGLADTLEEIGGLGLDSGLSGLCGHKEKKAKDRCSEFGECEYVKQFSRLRTKPDLNISVLPHALINANRSMLYDFKSSIVIVDEQFLGEIVGSGEATKRQIEAVPALLDIFNAIQKAQINHTPVLEQIRKDVLNATELLHEARDKHRIPAFSLEPNMPPQEIEQAIRNRPVSPRWWELSKILLDLLHSEDEDTQRIHIDEDRDRVPVIRWHWIKPLKNLEDKPLILLDGTSDPEVLRRVFPNLEVKTFRVKRNVEQVVQITNAEQTHQHLAPDQDSTHENIKRAEAFKVQLRDFAELNRREYGPGMICGPKRFTDSLNLPEGVVSRHFGNLRGIDAHKNDQWAVVIGRNQTPPHNAEGIARAIFADDDEPLVFGFGKQDAGIRMRNGDVTKVCANFHKDSRVQAVETMLRERETEQAIDRLRLIHSSAKTIYILSCLPLDITVDEAVKDRRTVIGAPRLNTMLVRHKAKTFPMVAAWIHAHHKDLFSTRTAAKRWLNNKVPIPLIYNHRGSGTFKSEISFRTQGQRGRPSKALTLRNNLDDAQRDLEQIFEKPISIITDSGNQTIKPILEIVPPVVRPHDEANALFETPVLDTVQARTGTDDTMHTIPVERNIWRHTLPRIAEFVSRGVEELTRTLGESVSVPPPAPAYGGGHNDGDMGDYPLFSAIAARHTPIRTSKPDPSRRIPKHTIHEPYGQNIPEMEE